MAISNEQYNEYLDAIASRDCDALKDAVKLVKDAKDALQPFIDSVKDLRDNLPPVRSSVTATQSRSNIDNLYAQISGFATQLGYLQNAFDNTIQQYNADPVAPNTAGPVVTAP